MPFYPPSVDATANVAPRARGSLMAKGMEEDDTGAGGDG